VIGPVGEDGRGTMGALLVLPGKTAEDDDDEEDIGYDAKQILVPGYDRTVPPRPACRHFGLLLLNGRG
jgi:hypothetical protein